MLYIHIYIYNQEDTYIQKQQNKVTKKRHIHIQNIKKNNTNCKTKKKIKNDKTYIHIRRCISKTKTQ